MLSGSLFEKGPCEEFHHCRRHRFGKAPNPGATIAPMRRMVLGRTGLEVHRLGFGGIPIQRVSEAEAVETVRHAIERGLDFIDTSRAYTTSERRIGLALKQGWTAPPAVEWSLPPSRTPRRRTPCGPTWRPA